MSVNDKLRQGSISVYGLPFFTHATDELGQGVLGLISVYDPPSFVAVKDLFPPCSEMLSVRLRNTKRTT